MHFVLFPNLQQFFSSGMLATDQVSNYIILVVIGDLCQHSLRPGTHLLKLKFLAQISVCP